MFGTKSLGIPDVHALRYERPVLLGLRAVLITLMCAVTKGNFSGDAILIDVSD
jgi:hypothetical protein